MRREDCRCYGALPLEHRPPNSVGRVGRWLWMHGRKVYRASEEVRRRLIASRQAYGIGFREGAEALERAIVSGLPHLYVTTRNIDVMVDESRGLTATRADRTRHPRPILASSYAGATTPIENTIAALWETWLGIDGIGIDDNFFELGGNSLLAVNVIDHIRRHLKLAALPAQLIRVPDYRNAGAALRSSGRRDRGAGGRRRTARATSVAFRHFQETALPDEAL